MKGSMSELKGKISSLTEEIRSDLKHDDLCQHTYHINDLSVTVVNPAAYRINTDKYLEARPSLKCRGLDFVRRKVSYEIDKGRLASYLQFAMLSDKELINSFVETKLSPPRVTVKPNKLDCELF